MNSIEIQESQRVGNIGARNAGIHRRVNIRIRQKTGNISERNVGGIP
jgi:hypothetical protein